MINEVSNTTKLGVMYDSSPLQYCAPMAKRQNLVALLAAGLFDSEEFKVPTNGFTVLTMRGSEPRLCLISTCNPGNLN